MPKRERKPLLISETPYPVGIVGLGMVGGPLMRWFQDEKGYRRGDNLFCYDTDPKLPYKDDVNQARVIFVCVPTPPNPDGSCNTSIVELVVSCISDDHIVVIKSTVPPGTTRRLQQEHPGKCLMFNPEFLTEKQAWEDFIKPSRQLIGVTEQSLPFAIDVLRLLPPAPFHRPDTPVYGGRQIVTATEAEFAKYASNVFGAMKVVFGNILADLCHAHGNLHGEQVSYENVRDMLGADQRIGDAWLDVSHGLYSGFGGFCFPKDTEAFRKFAHDTWEQFAHKNLSMRSATLSKAHDFLEAMLEYNEQLLHEQGLDVEDVSYHDRDIVLKKHRPIRQ